MLHIIRFVEPANPDSLLNKSEFSKGLKPAIPPSIPYSDYLRSYRIDRTGVDTNLGSFFHPYVPPSQSLFVPEKVCLFFQFQHKIYLYLTPILHWTRPVKRKGDHCMIIQKIAAMSTSLMIRHLMSLKKQ